MRRSWLYTIVMYCVALLIVSCSGGGSEREGASEPQQQRSSEEFVDNDPAFVVGSFNIKWLGDGERDRVKREAKHVRQLASILEELQPEVWGLQEIENEAALQWLLEECRNVPYTPYIAESGAQRCALLVRNDVRCDSTWEVPELQVGNRRLRAGLAAHVTYRGRDAVVMSIHFKSTSRYDSTASLRARSYTIRARQSQSLCQWVQETTSAIDEDVIVVGDFNDSPVDPATPTLMALESCEQLVCATSDLESCNPKYQYGIDHVYVSTSLVDENRQDLTHMQFSMYENYSAQDRRKLSDHCPVLVRLENFATE